ncbi:MAG: hypothetical protein Q4B81_00180 [Moraxella sp.]|nr:hypothetical protein [Moraxella sp.]
MFEILANFNAKDELEYDFDEMEQYGQAVKERYLAYCVNQSITPKDFLKHCLDVQHERIMAKPIRYRAYGGYWWSLKQLFIKYGYDFGMPTTSQWWHDMNDGLADWYKGNNDLHTVLLADRFYNQYYPSHVAGSNTFHLPSMGMTPYTLFDPAMELVI